MWDVAYLTHKGKKEYLKMNISEFYPYFSIGACMEGLNNLLQNLLGISLVNTKLGPGESWESNIYKLSGKCNIVENFCSCFNFILIAIIWIFILVTRDGKFSDRLII